MEIVTHLSLWELIKHLSRWLANLSRAGDARKRQSIVALRKVITASRQTRVYIRQLDETGIQSHATESALAVNWTNLGFELNDLGLNKLAKRCDIKGRYWADPQQFEPEYLDKADIALDRMEQLAGQMVAGIER